MNKALAILLLTVLTSPAWAASKASYDQRIVKLTQRFMEMQSRSDRRVPADKLREAQAIVLLERTKAGFIFAYQGGSGVALARDPDTGKWSAVSFLKADEASLGFLIGGQQSFLVILFMNQDAARILTTSTMDFGGEARGTAGDASAVQEGTIAGPQEAVLVYDIREGLYGGAAIKGGAVAPDAKANMEYYDQAITTKEILFDRKVEPTERAIELAAKIEEFAE